VVIPFKVSEEEAGLDTMGNQSSEDKETTKSIEMLSLKELQHL
jgi:hypothetical protein